MVEPCDILRWLPVPPEGPTTEGRRRCGPAKEEFDASDVGEDETDADRWIHSSKLLEALRRLRRSSPAMPPRTQVVREAADWVLAAVARGQTRWSYAILSGGCPLRLKARRSRAAVD
uniref:Transcription factor bHLH148-like n=2 Tax=Elaeis guineensis var. tenera TaxID=51953 RepID=A0A6J0PSH1_ELAGV|nr:transcription factor bHLH148-like [Elaeis guineensis]